MVFIPRTIFGLKGILFSPFIHSTDSWSHIINNSPPLFVLLWLSFITFKKRVTLRVLGFIWFVSGIWVWIAARESYHIGASGLVYGLAFFLFFSGVLRKNKQLLGVSLLVAFLYGSMVWGLFPIDLSVSFEAHLFGAIAGITMAFYMKNKGPKNDKYNLTVDPEFEEFVEEYNTEMEIQKEQNSSSNSSSSSDTEISYHFVPNKK